MSDDVLTKSELQEKAKAEKPKVEKKYSESLGKHIYFKQISAAENDAYEHSLVRFVDREDGTTDTEQNPYNMRAKFIGYSLCDKVGRRLLTDEEAQEFGESTRPEIVRELYRLAIEVNGTKEEQEDDRKNSNTEATGGSPSD